jgi:hypothetical protein
MTTGESIVHFQYGLFTSTEHDDAPARFGLVEDQVQETLGGARICNLNRLSLLTLDSRITQLRHPSISSVSHDISERSPFEVSGSATSSEAQIDEYRRQESPLLFQKIDGAHKVLGLAAPAPIPPGKRLEFRHVMISRLWVDFGT